MVAVFLGSVTSYVSWLRYGVVGALTVVIVGLVANPHPEGGRE
jgi:hypothetical protein